MVNFKIRVLFVLIFGDETSFFVPKEFLGDGDSFSFVFGEGGTLSRMPSFPLMSD